jgi:hypothetical protein
MWTPECLSKSFKIGEARLVPLNKDYPNIPLKDRFRPIVILSILFKWLELRFLEKLNVYLVNQLDRNQIGFVLGLGT